MAIVRGLETIGWGITMVFTSSPGRSCSVAISVIWRLGYIPSLSLPASWSRHTLAHHPQQRGELFYNQPTANQLSPLQHTHTHLGCPKKQFSHLLEWLVWWCWFCNRIHSERVVKRQNLEPSHGGRFLSWYDDSTIVMSSRENTRVYFPLECDHSLSLRHHLVGWEGWWKCAFSLCVIFKRRVCKLDLWRHSLEVNPGRIFCVNVRLRCVNIKRHFVSNNWSFCMLIIPKVH